MRKLMSVSAIMAVLSLPAYATIQSGSTCDTTNLGQSENNSTANVEADWTANTININWYIDDSAQTTMATNTCTYDGTITLPTQPTKTGYTFAGWQLRAANSGSVACSNYSTHSTCNANTACFWYDDGNECMNLSSCNNLTRSDCVSATYCSPIEGESYEGCIGNSLSFCHDRTTQSTCDNTFGCVWDVDTCYSIVE